VARKFKLPPKIRALFEESGRRGGKASAASLTPEQRSARSAHAAALREAKRKNRSVTEDAA